VVNVVLKPKTHPTVDCFLQILFIQQVGLREQHKQEKQNTISEGCRCTTRLM